MSTPVIHDIHNYYEELTVKGEPKPVIGNYETRLAVCLVFPIEDVAVAIRGPAGSAKTNILEGMTQGVWGDRALEDEVEQCLVISGGSDKALLSGDMVQRINNMVTHVVISELENIADNEVMKATVKQWLEKKTYVYHRSVEFGKATESIPLAPRPVCTTLATENARMPELGEEMDRRVMTFWTESNLAMNRRVHRMKARMEFLPNRMIYKGGMAKLTELQQHFADIRDWKGSFLNGIKIRNPCADFMSERIPKRFTLSNTHIGYWHAAVRAVAAWNFQEREVFHDGEQDFILATPQDNFDAWTIMGKAVVHSSLKLRDMGEVLMEVIPIGGEGQAIDSNSIYDRVVENGYERSKPQIKSLVNQLIMSGYVQCTETSPLRFWRTRDYAAEIGTAIDWKGCIDSATENMKEFYPAIAVDYVPMFCADPEIQHPVTGEKLKLLDNVENLYKGKGVARHLVKRTANLMDLDSIPSEV